MLRRGILKPYTHFCNLILTPKHTEFYNELNNLADSGYPSKVIKHAISYGAGNGSEGEFDFNPGDDRINVTGEKGKWDWWIEFRAPS